MRVNDKQEMKDHLKVKMVLNPHFSTNMYVFGVKKIYEKQ